MRLLDIAAASSFALLSLAVILTINPAEMRIQSSKVAADSAAARALLSYLRVHDLQFLATSDPARICSTLAGWNNSSAVISISLDHVPCAAASDRLGYPGRYDLKVSLPTREVELEARAR